MKYPKEDVLEVSHVKLGQTVNKQTMLSSEKWQRLIPFPWCFM